MPKETPMKPKSQVCDGPVHSVHQKFDSAGNETERTTVCKDSQINRKSTLQYGDASTTYETEEKNTNNHTDSNPHQPDPNFAVWAIVAVLFVLLMLFLLYLFS